MTRESLCDEWATDLAAIEWEQLPPSVRERTLITIFDAIGIAAGGLEAPGVRQMLRGIERASGTGDIPVPWTAMRLGPTGAAMALSTLIHAWDFDDTHDEATVHTSTVALPAAFAAALCVGASGDDLLAGVAAGIQTLVRISLAIGPQRGIVRTAGLGAFGAAAAAARTMRLDPTQFVSALQLALPSTGAPTSRQVIEDSAVNKRVQPAQAAAAGLTAAFLAAEGISGPAGWMCGSYGILNMAEDPDAAIAALRAPGWEVAELSLKPYPCCRYTHSAISGFLQTGAKSISRSLVHVPVGTAYDFVSRPFARRGQPIIDAQFSIPWLGAAALIDSRVDLETMLDDRLLDPEIEDLAARISVVQDLQPTKDNMAPAHVELDSGEQVQSVWVHEAPGSPGAPMGWEDVSRKAGPCALVGGLSKEMIPILMENVRRLESAGQTAIAHITPVVGAAKL